MKLVWVAPSDRGGGVIWVADSCCRQAVADDFDALLLTLESLSKATRRTITYPTHSLDVEYPYVDTPARFLAWIAEHQPDVVFLNNVDTMDCCIPYLPPEVRCVYVVHDTMTFYHKAAVRHEASLDAIVAVSAATAGRFRHKLSHPERLHVIPNGTVFPERAGECDRTSDLVFLGGADSRKGAFDVLELWPRLLGHRFSGTLHWYGRVPDEFARRIASLPERERIVIHGHVPRTQIFERLEQTKVLLMLSRGEACSIAALESMAMGCIPVAWDIELTGTREIIRDGYRFLAALGDFDEMARQTIQALAAGAAISDGLSAIARTDYTEARMWHLYRQVIDGIARQPLPLRPRAGQPAPAYHSPLRASHLIPQSVWRRVHPHIARSAKVYYFLRKQL